MKRLAEKFRRIGIVANPDKVAGRAAVRTAAVTGWAIDSSALYRMRCDAAFPLSDHADFNDLLQFVEPRVVTENTIRQGFAPLER
mgnify:CR=1 FL=1